MSKPGFVRFVLAVLIVLVGCFSPVARCEEDPAGQMAIKVTRFDMENEIGAMWWTGEFWAGMAYMDKGPDAVLGCHMMKTLGKEHLFFSLMNVIDQSVPVVTDGPAALTSSNGVKVDEVKVHDSFSEIMPGLMAFPRHDSDGKAIVAEGAEKVTLVVKLKDVERKSEFDWSLPINYPAFVDEAKEWLLKPIEKSEDEMTEGEIINKYLPSVLRLDPRTGVMAVYLTSEMSNLIIALEPGLKDNEILRKVVESIVSEYSIFFIGTIKGKEDERVPKMAESAKAVGVNGKKFDMNIKARDDFLASIAEDEEEGEEREPYEFMFFPQLGGEGAVELILEDPETKSEVSFKWEM